MSSQALDRREFIAGAGAVAAAACLPIALATAAPPAGDATHLDAHRLLRLQNGAGAEGIAAVERQRMVENMKHAGHGHTRATEGLTQRQPRCASRQAR